MRDRCFSFVAQPCCTNPRSEADSALLRAFELENNLKQFECGDPIDDKIWQDHPRLKDASMLLCIHLLVLRCSCQALCSHFFHEKLAIRPSKVLDSLTWTQCVADQRRCIWQIWYQRLKLLRLSLAYGTCTLKHSQVTSKQSMFEFAPILIILILSWYYPDIILISSWYYPDIILILSWYHPDIILILSWYYPDIILISSWYYPDIILILSWYHPDTRSDQPEA